jgi:hypothetical protein
LITFLALNINGVNYSNFKFFYLKIWTNWHNEENFLVLHGGFLVKVHMEAKDFEAN